MIGVLLAAVMVELKVQPWKITGVVEVILSAAAIVKVTLETTRLPDCAPDPGTHHDGYPVAARVVDVLRVTGVGLE
jgi:hypothetical protein